MSPRNKQQIEVIRTQSKEAILDATFKLMAKKGYESTSISQIAAEAGISKGLVYNYFESKEDILKTLVTTAFAEGDHIMNELMHVEDTEKTLKNLFNWFFEELRTRSEFWKLITELSFQTEKFGFVKTIVTKKMEEYITVLSGLLRQTGSENSIEEARVLVAIFDGIGFHYLILKEKYPLDEMESFLIDKYCKNKKGDPHEK